MKRKMWWYKRSSWPHLLARWLMLFATTGYVLLPTSVVWANPSGEQVVGGSATFDRQGNTLTVNQATDRLAVNWQDFSIAAGETTHFNMPSSASIALNRVLGGNPSQIYGTLSSNGNIILVNNAGIFVGPGGVVNAASFVGSTLDIDPGQFMQGGVGGYQLHGDSYAPIVNQGNITAEKGDVFLIAQKVENRGTISAPNGRAALVGAGRAADRTEVVLHEVGGSGFAVRVAQLEGEAAQGMNGDLPDGEELLNEGEIAAAQAELNASGNIYALAIKNTGTIRAKAVVAQADGTVRLDGGLGDVMNTGKILAKNAGDEATAAGGKIEMTGQNVTASPESVITAAGGEQGGNGGKVKLDSADTTIVQGKVDVTAPSAGARGGKVELLGERVGLFDGAKVDASGGAGGGTVLAGGDYLGGQTPKPELVALAQQEAEPVKNAKATVMAETAEIKADATVNGDGGKIILWSDEYTGFYGQLFARGGLGGGNGGFIETSSKDNLQAFGAVTSLASNGERGLWLIDPVNVTITANNSSGGTPANMNAGGTWVPNASGSNINVAEINTALATTSVTITTSATVAGVGEPGTITVSAPITGNAGSLFLNADGNIIINNSITLNSGNISLNSIGGSITTATGANIASITGSVSLIAGGGAITLNGTTTAAGILGRSSGDIQINNAVTSTGGGTIQLISAGDVTGPGLISLDPVGGLSIDTTRDVSVSVTAGPVAVRTTGDVTLFGGAAGTTTLGLVNGINGLSGADISVTAGTIELGDAPVDATGDFTALAATGIDFIAPSNRFSPAVTTGGNQSFQGDITLSADTALASGGNMQFNNTIDGAFDLLLLVQGFTDLFDQVGATTPLTSFRQEGGLINFYAASSPAITTSGSTTFDGANPVLWENTTFSSGSDLIVLGTIDSSFADTPVVLDVTAAGNVILDGAVGGNAALGAVSINATGGQIAINSGITTLPGTIPFHTGADGSISLTAGGAVVIAGAIDTRGGLSADTGIGGDLTITSGGGLNQNIQIESTINTRGGSMTFQNAVFFTGASNLDTTAGNVAGAIDFNDAVDGSALATIQGGTGQVTFTGAVGGESPLQLDLLSAGGVTFSSSVLFGATANITSYSGAVSFASTVNKINGGVLLLDLGNQSLGFSGAVGGANPFSLQVTSSGAVTLGGPVNMGGNFDFLNLSGPFAATGAINSVANGTTGYDLTINPANSGVIVSLQGVGTTSPLGGVTINSGGGGITLNGSIFTAGGNVDMGSAVTLATGAITVDTTRLGNPDGGDILFRQTLSGNQALSLNSGITGNIRFGQGSTGLASLTVTGAGGGFSMAQTVSVAGLIDINAPINPVAAGEDILFTSTAGDIVLRQGIQGQSLTTQGSDVTLSAASGTVTVVGTITLNGASLVGGSPGFRGGNLEINAEEISVQDINTLGGGDNEPLSPGAAEGGNVNLTATAGDITTGGITTQGGLQGVRGSGGRAGNVTLDAFGILTTGSLNLSGGETQEGVGGGAGTLTLISGDRTILIGGINVSGGNGGGGGTGGTAGTINFGDIEIGVSSVLIRAVGGENGQDTVAAGGTVGRGADGQLNFNGTINGSLVASNNLEIDVGAGTVTFNASVGGTTELGQLTIVNARDVTFSALAGLQATRFVQNQSVPAAGIYVDDNQAGTTTFNGGVTLSGTGTALDLTGYNFTFNAPVSLSNGSAQASFAGVFSLNDALTLGGDLTLADENVPNLTPRLDLGANITTSAGALQFGDGNPLNVRLTANSVTLSTGTSGGQITFDGLLDGDGGSRSLTFVNGGTTTFNDLIGSLSPLENLTTSTTGSTVFAAAGTRADPSANLTGTALLQNQIQLEDDTVLRADGVTLAGTGLLDGANDLLLLLNTGAFTLNGQVGRDTPLASLRVEGGSGVTFGFAGTQANPSVATTGNQYYQTAVTLGAATVLDAGSMDFLSTIDGAQSLFLDSAGNINLYGRVGLTPLTALTQFQSAGNGVLNLLALGASGADPTIRTTGAQLFGSALVLGEDTFLTSTTSGDFIFLNTIDSRLANQPRGFTVSGQGKVVLEAAAGVGTGRLASASLTGAGDVTVLAGINTFGGAIDLESTGGSVVLSGNTDTGVADQLGGAINLTANTEVILNGGVISTFGGNVAVSGPAFTRVLTTIATDAGSATDGTVTFSSTLDGAANLAVNAGTALVTFSGALGGNQPLDLTVGSAGGVTFSSAVTLGSGATSITSLAGNVQFAGTVDKLGGAFTMTLGTSDLSFLGAIGSNRPFGLTVNSSGGITMDGPVRMGGAFTFNNVTGPVAVNSTLDGTFGFTVNPVNDVATVSLGAVGSLIPVAFLTVGVGNAEITLNDDVITAGGPINLGSPVTLASSVNLQTTALGAAGGTINFRNSLTGGGAEDLTINAGSGGLSFGGPVSQLRDLNVLTAGLFTFTAAAEVDVARDILITPQVTSGGNVTMTAGRNVTLTSGLLARQDPGPGANVTITATTGDINVGAIIEISARSGTYVIESSDGSAFTVVGTPGFNAGSLTLEGNNITVGAINAIGSNNFVTGGNGGNGGTVTLTSDGAKTVGAINVSGGNGGPAGRAGGIVLAGAGENFLSGNITGNGGNGEAGSPGASGAVLDFTGQTIVINGATVQVTALGGSDSVGGGRGQDGNFTFGTLRSAADAQNNLLLNVGRGSMVFGGPVGVDAAGAFGQITVVNALNVTFNDLLRTSRFVQNASVPDQSPYTLNSAGQTLFDEVILEGTGVAMELTGYNFTFGGPVNSTLGGGSIQVTNGGILAIRDDLTLGGNFTQIGAEDFETARVEIGANLSTSSGAITLASNARLVDRATITIDTGTGGGAITFGALLDSDATARALVLNSGGTVTLEGLVGSLNPLASLETNAGGSLVLAAAGSDAVPSLNVTGGVVIRDQMSLQEDTVVRSGSFALFNGGTIEGGQDLKFLVQGGAMVLQGQVGGVTPLASLWVEGANGGISLNFAGTELFPSVRTTGAQHYGSAVNLNSDNYLLAGGAMTFVNTIRAAINGGQGLTLDSGGLIRLQGLVGGGGLALSQLAVLGGGSLQFLANPGVDASVTTTGSQLYSAALLLGQDTSLLSTTSGDFDFTSDATIDSLTLNQPRALTVNGQGKIVIEADLGSNLRLGAVNLGAVGDITVLENLDTFGANVTMNSSAGTLVFAGNMSTGVAEQLGGNISLTAAEEIQLEGQLASRGGTVGMNASVYLSGASAIDTRSGGLQDGAVNFSDTLNGAALLDIQSGTAPVTFAGQVGYQSPFVLRVGNSGGIVFQQEAMLSGGSSFVTANGNLHFQNLLDVAGGGLVTITQSPFDQATFSGAVGSLSPFQLTLAAGGGISFEEAVVLGGAFNLATEGNGVEFLSTVDGAGSLLIDTAVGNVRFGGAVGAGTPLATGGLQIGVGTGTTTLGGNITTEGGVVAIGNSVVLDADVEIFTGAGLVTTGRSISFNKGITAPGGQGLILDAGSSGGILLGGSVGTAADPLGSFTIRNGGAVVIGTSGGIFSDGNVLINPELAGLFPKGSLLISSASGGITLEKGGVLTGQFQDGNNNSDGSSLTMSAAGDILVRALLDLSGGDNDYDGGGSGFSSGTLTLVSTGGRILLDTVQLLGGDAATAGAGGLGGVATIQATGAITIRQLLANGGDGVGIVGGAGGNVTVVRTGATGAMDIGTVAAQGGDSTDSFGGLGGLVTLRADLGDFSVPTDFFVAGGEGSADAFVGQGGQVTLEATAGSLSFANQTMNLDGDGSLRVVAGQNLILATTPDLILPELSAGGVIINLNGEALRPDRRGTMSFAYGAANTGGQFFMPSSSYLLSNGGNVAINTAATLNLVPVGGVTISGITTSGTSLNGGRILINQAPAVAGLVGDVSVLGTLETAGGIPGSPTYGRTGGQILITGDQITLHKVITRGSDSLASATVPAFGGAGGDLSVTGSLITLRRDLDTSGGNGLGTGDANGGAGGQIQLFGNVVIDSGSASRPAIVWNTQGGTLRADGDDGLGGNITLQGSLTGTEATSNTLDLRYGSGTVTLGNTVADTITLGTLITAADDARSTGNLILNGALEVGTLTTYARGYGIQINGGGTVDNTVTFNNTGNIGLGSLAATTIFTGGLTASAPASVQLRGLIESGDATNPGTGAPMSFGVVELVGNTTLNSNGSNLSLGRIDGAFDLTLAAGIGVGVVDISSTIGANTRVGAITVSEGIVQPVTFRDSIRATTLDGQAGTALSFFGNVDLTGSATLQGLTTLDNTLFESQNSTLDFLVGAASSLNEVVLVSGPIRLTGAGNYSIQGAVTGDQNLKLAGAGTKVFASTIGSATAPVGSGVAGIDQADGSGTVTFQGDVFTSGVSTFDGSVVLSGMTYTSADRVDFGGDLFDTVTLEAGTVTLAGAGEKVFNGTVDSTVGLVQGATAGKVTFENDVTSTGVAGTFSLAGDVEFAGLVFSSGGEVSLSKAVTLSQGQVTLTGVGAYTVAGTLNGAQNLVLAGGGTKSFTGAIGATTAIGTGAGAAIQISGGDVTLGAVTAASGISSASALTLTGNTQVLASGDTDSNFANTVQMAGITFTSGLGVIYGADVTLASGSAGASTTTLGGTGAYLFLGDLNATAAGVQSLAFTSTGDVIFGGIVGTVRLGGLSQTSTAGGMEFQANVFTAGSSTFAGNVILSGMAFDANGATLFNTVELGGVTVTLSGEGTQTFTGLLTGNGVDLNLNDGGNKTLAEANNVGVFTINSAGITSLLGNVTATSVTQNGGSLRLGGDVTTTGGVNLDLATSITTLGSVVVTSAGDQNFETTLILGGNLEANAGAGNQVRYGSVSGSGNMTTTASSISVTPTTVRNAGTFTGIQAGGGNMSVGTGGTFMNEVSLGAVRSTGGILLSTSGDITANGLTAGTGLGLVSTAGQVSMDTVSAPDLSVDAASSADLTSVTTPGSLAIKTGAASTVNFLGSSSAGSLSLDTGSLGALNSSVLSVPSLGGITLRAPGNFSYTTAGNLTVGGRISLLGGGAVELMPAGNFVNNFAGNPFTASGGVRVLTQDFFSYPNSAGVVGLTPVFGVTSVLQLGANQIGVAKDLLAGSAGPFITEFTTGTGQPYILATQENAVPAVMMPATYTVSGAFPTRVSYSAEELEMMTPEERSAYEAGQRRESARVILERQPGQPEVGVPTEGEIPQAKAGEPAQPAPTAQVLLQGKPLAGKSDKEKGDSTQLLRIRPAKAVALRPEMDAQRVMEGERLAAEVNVGSAPVAGTGR